MIKINTLMPSELVPYYRKELFIYENLFKKGDYSQAWKHLENAHVIGQAYPWHHSYVHYKMLLFGIHIKNTKEIIGQIPRLLIGGVKSFVGQIPTGNTGGANVHPLKKMSFSDEIRNIFDKAGLKEYGPRS